MGALSTRTEYDMDSDTVIVRPSSSTMTVMNVTGLGKELLEVMNPDVVSTVSKATPFLSYTPDFDRIVETIAPSTRMEGFIFGGVADDIKQNMLNKRRDLSVDQIDVFVGNTVAEMNARNISEFASYDDLNAYTRRRYNLEADQVFDAQSIKLLLGTDRYSITLEEEYGLPFGFIPVKPTFYMPNSFQRRCWLKKWKVSDFV